MELPPCLSSKSFSRLYEGESAYRAAHQHPIRHRSRHECPIHSRSSLGKLRSAGITDLRYGNLLDEDWQGIDRFGPAHDQRHAVPLPKGVSCYAIAADMGSQSNKLLGDGMVTVNSALGYHEDPRLKLSFAPARQWIAYGINHWDLLNQSAVYKQIRRWIACRGVAKM
jgi:hypothetical protein